MKPSRSTIWVLLMGLLLTVFAVGLAQSPSQSNQKKQSEAASCAMDTCCCKGDSCSVKHEGTAATESGGCCSGGSCDMKTKESMNNHSASDGCCCCHGDSCDARMKEKMQNHESGVECCCDMKMKHKDMKHMKSRHKAA